MTVADVDYLYLGSDFLLRKAFYFIWLPIFLAYQMKAITEKRHSH